MARGEGECPFQANWAGGTQCRKELCEVWVPETSSTHGMCSVRAVGLAGVISICKSWASYDFGVLKQPVPGLRRSRPRGLFGF